MRGAAWVVIILRIRATMYQAFFFLDLFICQRERAQAGETAGRRRRREPDDVGLDPDDVGLDPKTSGS